MWIKIIRWLWLVTCLFLSWLLINNVSQLNFIIITVSLSLGWFGYTFLIKRKWKWSLLSYVLTPILLWVSALTLVLLVSPTERWLIIVITLLLSWAWASTLAYVDGQPDSGIFRGNLLSYLNSFIFFFAISGLYGIITFFNLRLADLFLLVLGFSFILHWQIMAASHLKFSVVWLYSLISALLLLEMFVALALLPTSFLVNGLVMTTIFYVVSGIGRCELTSILSRTLIFRYLVWGGFLIFIILVTARWE